MKSLLMSQIKIRLRLAMKEEIECRKNNISGSRLNDALCNKIVSRTIISMCPETGYKPDQIPDSEVGILLKRYLKQEKVRMLYSARYITAVDVEGKGAKDAAALEKQRLLDLNDFLINDKIKTILSYLPDEISPDVIKEFILSNCPKEWKDGKIIGEVMKFYKGQADGNLVKKVLQEVRDE